MSTSRLFIIFGQTGFVGARFANELGDRVVDISRDGNSYSWTNGKPNLSNCEVTVIIASGSARFAAKTGKDFDLEIVKKIIDFLRNQQIVKYDLVYVSSLAAKLTSSGNTYGNSKLQAENFLLTNINPCQIWRAPALYGRSMSNDSHLNWFLRNRFVLWALSIFSKSGISLLHVDDFVKQVVIHWNTCTCHDSIHYPKSGLLAFSNLHALVSPSKLQGSKSIISLPFWVAKLMPFKLKPLISPLWEDRENSDPEVLQVQILKISNHLKRFQGSPTMEAPILVFGAAGGLGRSICGILELKKYPFVAIDQTIDSNIEKMGACLQFLQVNLVDTREWKGMLETVSTYPEISWIITAAGMAIKGEISETPDEVRAKFWRLMVETRISITAWAQRKSLQQSHIGVIHISSSTSFIPFIQYPEYSAANAAVRVFSKVATGKFDRLTTHTVIPGGMKTNLMKEYGDLKKYHAGAMDPHVVAVKVVKLLSNRKNSEILVGTTSRMLNIASRVPGQKFVQKLVNASERKVR